MKSYIWRYKTLISLKFLFIFVFHFLKEKPFKNVLPINGLGIGLVSTKINGLGTYCGGGLCIEKVPRKFEAPGK